MPNRKTILLFTDWYEPGFKAGGPIQSCKNLVNTLCCEYDFCIFTSDRDLGDALPYKEIETDRWITLANGARILYASPAWVNSSRIRQVINDLNPQIIYLNSMFSAKFSILPLWVIKSMNFKGKIILAPRGMLSKSAISRKKWKKKIFLSLFSMTGISKKIIYHATDDQEQSDIKAHFGDDITVSVVQNIPNVYEGWNSRVKQTGELKCVFISRIHPIKNLLFAFQVLKNAKGCSVHFDIYGSVEDKKYYQECIESSKETGPAIVSNFRGPLSHHDIFTVLQEYHLFFLPTTGENFGHVIFEALSSGCPALISDRTPWKDLEENNSGWALPLNNIVSFVEKLTEVCMMNETTFNIRSKAAHEYAGSYMAAMNYKNKYARLFESGQ